MFDSGAHGRKLLVLATTLAGVLRFEPCAFALNPALDVSQYGHTAFKSRNGFSKGAIRTIAQTPDGYLWLGTEFGLLRFDGVRCVVWEPQPGQHLPSNAIFSLLAAQDGTLWIGTSKGLASLKDGKLTEYPELAGQNIRVQILEDHEGTVWAGGLAPPPGKLCAIRNCSIHCYGQDGSLGDGVRGLFEDHDGNLWVALRDGLWRWRPGAPKFYPEPGPGNGIQGLAESDNGALLFGPRNGISRLTGGKIEPYLLPKNVPQFTVTRMLRGRDGNLWIGTEDQGLVHVQRGKIDVFRQADGLSGDLIQALFIDRENTIWVATDGGLDHFREFAVPTLSLSQGLSNASVLSVLADRDGSVWLSTRRGLNRWNNGRITIFGKPGANGLLNGHYAGSLFQDSRGRIWASTLQEFGYLENGRFVAARNMPGGPVYSIMEDPSGNLWIANKNSGLIHLLRDGRVQQIPWVGLGHKDYALSLAVDPLRRGLWIGFYEGGIVYFADGKVRATYSAADGLGEGRVSDLRFDPGGTLWAATQGGLSRFKNGRFATLTMKNGLPCDSAHWVMEDNDHSFWMYTTCGLVRLARAELDAWAAASDKQLNVKQSNAKPFVHATVFDNSDGVRTIDDSGGYTPHVAKSSDGRIWFLPSDGASVVDPHRVPFNRLPPPVAVERITANHRIYGGRFDEKGSLSLPALTRDLEIGYTALSLVAPEKVQFQYKLEGLDQEWQEVGNRRQASYANLPPGGYRFRVVACNNSGVWNEAGASLDFEILPMYYQTVWFRMACLAAFLGSLGAVYRLRLRKLAAQFEMRLEERLNERTRIARDFHDTLLQTIQGSKMVAEDALDESADPIRMRQALESLFEWLERAVEEGRSALNSLRSSTTEGNDLAEALQRAGEECLFQRSIEFDLSVEGRGEQMHPIIRDEVYRIGYEAIRNACIHSEATRLSVKLSYAENLTLRVRDNGKGIDSEVAAKGKVGHFGLIGMYERASRVRGRLTLSSSPGAGTEVELVVPRKVAFRLPSTVRRSWFAKLREGRRAAGRSF